VLKKKPTLVGAAFVASLAMLSLSFAQDSKEDPIKQKFEEIRKLDLSGSKEDSLKAATMLKNLKKAKLDFNQNDDRVRYSRDMAIRLGDLAWLQELSKEENIFPSDLVYTVLLAYGKLTKADLAGAEKLISGINPEEINLRDARRIYAIRVRIAELKKDVKTERKFIEKMIEHLPSWPGDHCQTCHDSPKEKSKVTSLPLKTLWFGQRYSEMLKQSGDAAKVKAECEANLKEMPDDDLSKIRLAYALRALGKTKEGDAVLESISYCEGPKNDSPKARMFFAFP
jgi:hypothetical protein